MSTRVRDNPGKAGSMTQNFEPVILATDLGTSSMKVALITYSWKSFSLGVGIDSALLNTGWWRRTIATRMVAGFFDLLPAIIRPEFGSTVVCNCHLLFHPGGRHDSG